MALDRALPRRTFLSLSAATAGAFALAACGGGSTPAAVSAPGSASGSAPGSASAGGKLSGNVRALFMKQASYSTDNINAMTASFEAANPGVKVTPDFVGYDALHDKIVTSAPAKTYDVILIDVIWPAEFASKNLISNITPQLPPSVTDAIFTGALQSSEYKQQYYGVPWILDTEYLFYNKSMLKKAGVTAVPKSWEDVAAAGRAIKTAKAAKYPFIWAALQAEELVCAYGAVLGAYGGTWLDSSGNPSFNTGGGVAALEFMRMTFEQGLADPASLTSSGDDVRKAVSQGDVAMCIDWTYMYALANDKTQSNVAGQIGIAHTPSGPGGAPGINGSMALSVTSTSQNPTAALAYINHLTSVPIQNKYAALSLPIWKASYDPSVKLAGVPAEVIQVAKGQLGNMLLRPQVPQYNAVSHVLQAELQNGLTGKKSAQQALNDAASQAKSLMAG
jgi:multiple sugar transport system substrate-binding protein